MEQLVFYLFATIAVVAGLVVVLQRKAIYSALALIVCFGSIAVLFYQLGAFFIAAIQVIVYAGAIMVMFLFVVMLIDPESEFFSFNRIRRVSVLALPMSAVLALILLWAMPVLRESDTNSQSLAQKGSIEVIARSLFSDYLLPFEVTSILILVAVLGAMVLAKKVD
ncbi:MAG: NADH-quinone oxidoreductase subunit J [Acidobacteriota bacterium]|nr:MAG: NADH-quinone oxidoreductase subunit J [Acidobacteriota bacterium]